MPDEPSPKLLELPAICRWPGRREPLEAPRLVPSATHLLPTDGFWDRLGRTGFFLRRTFWGKHAEIGRPAVELNEGWAHPQFCPSFKKALGTSPHRTVARLRDKSHSARAVAKIYLRELLRNVYETSGERVRDLVFTVPVESYDQYRAELQEISAELGVERTRFIDEPVAAAIGYGLGLSGRRRTVLVVDYGGGTLDLAVVALSPRQTEIGQCEVIAKAGRPIGGDVIDGWLLEAFAEAMGVELDRITERESSLWRQLLKDEARRVKEAVYFSEKTTFEMSPPKELRRVVDRTGSAPRFLDVTREEVVEILRSRGMYDVLDDCCEEVERQLAAAGLQLEDLDEVLMVGGSTLLPQVFRQFEHRYGRDKVRAWQPFEAVAFGAAGFAAGRFGQSDFLVHDYAIQIENPTSHEIEYHPIIEHGTRFPTPTDHWQQDLFPTCALGEPERTFKLIICEVSGRAEGRRFTWDAEGQLHRVGADGDAVQQLVVPLNATNPTLGTLNPPHLPGDRRARLRVSFGVDENRWLLATVTDLRTREILMNREAVVRLL